MITATMKYVLEKEMSVTSSYSNDPILSDESMASSRKRKATKPLDAYDEEKIQLFRSIKHSMEKRQKKEQDATNRFTASLDDDIRELPARYRHMAKNEIEIRQVIFKYQTQALDEEMGMTRQGNNYLPPFLLSHQQPSAYQNMPLPRFSSPVLASSLQTGGDKIYEEL